jgi:hypothetical protein
LKNVVSAMVKRASNMAKPRLRLVALKAAGRSRVTNGAVLLPGVDGRSTWVRRARDLINEHVADLGGHDNTSAAERSIVRRASVITVELERLEAKFALAGQASADGLDLYQRAAGNLRRLLEAVGLQRRPRDMTPTLDQYLAAKQRANDDDEVTEAAE